MEIPVGKWLFNKRATASTAKDMPSLPINNANGKWKPNANMGEAFPSVVLPIKFSAQKHVNMCGDACVNMMFESVGKTAPIDLKRNPRGAVQGMDRGDVQGDHGLVEWRPAWSRTGSWSDINPMRLAFGLAKYGPLMFSGSFARFVGTRWGHWIVVHGVVDETVYIADPWHGEDRHKSISWFATHVDDEPPLRIQV